jgi:hypothetical protein
LQLRRRLAEVTAYVAVRFETLPRLAELIAAGGLAADGRSPLARPIGDYVAGEVALESRPPFARVRDLPGYARALRQAFRRFRRGGIRGSLGVTHPGSPELIEALRLYDRFREMTSQFYDEEDLLDAAAEAVRTGSSSVTSDIGKILVVPPGAMSAGGVGLLAALAAAAPEYEELEESAGPAATRMILSPDPASEVREVVREVICMLEDGAGVYDVAVFHGAGPAYPRLLRERFDAAGIPTVSVPGIALSETAIGRAVLTLLSLPAQDYPRTHTMDLLGLDAAKDWLPAGANRVRNSQPAWDRVSRAAGITRGASRWRDGLTTYSNDLDERLRTDPYVIASEGQQRRVTFERDAARQLDLVIGELVAGLEPLKVTMPAAEFIDTVLAIVEAYMASDAEGYEDVLREIGQLGTVDAVGGSFNLRSFVEALRANLETGVLKEGRTRLGEGVLIGDYRFAAGMGFRNVVLCGAYEGSLPASATTEPLFDENTWASLQESHPFVESAKVRNSRNREAAQRAVRSAPGGAVVWSCPLYEPGATRDYYPSPTMVRAAEDLDSETRTASQLRGLGSRTWLRRSPSPLATMLAGRVIDAAEVTLRDALSLRASGATIDDGHPLARNVEMLRARRSSRFTEWDGNLAALSPAEWLAVRSRVGPTTLENYARCGFRYFARSILYLNAVEEPEDREMMGSAERGTLVHTVLERFFRDAKASERPKVGERWDASDRAHLARILDIELTQAKARGQTGRKLYVGWEAQLLKADLMRFLDMDSDFRAETGAVPSEFEAPLPEKAVGGVALRGSVDRIDRTPDGKRAWIIDYKTGGTSDFERLSEDPLRGGTKLQLPAYLAAAADASEVEALYWFITHGGGFEKIRFENTPENMARFEGTIKAIVDGVRAGAFPAVSGEINDFHRSWDNCRYCEFTRICSRRRDQEYDAKAGDEAMRPWQVVAKVSSPSDAAS